MNIISNSKLQQIDHNTETNIILKQICEKHGLGMMDMAEHRKYLALISRDDGSVVLLPKNDIDRTIKALCEAKKLFPEYNE